MREGPVQILSTKEISESLVTKAAEHNINLEQSSFIRIEFNSEEDVLAKMHAVSEHVMDVIITSTNAVQALIQIFGKFPVQWNFYCVGQNTCNRLREFFPEANITTAENSVSLGDVIIKQSQSPEFLYFCGDRRREELPSILKKAGRNLSEVELYRTINNPFFIRKDYDGFLFFSPSAVESFYSMNSVSSLCTCFAIGDTTAETLKRFHPGEIIVSYRTSPESLIQATIEYYKKN